MIIINKNSNNTFQLTLTENSTLSSPYYLFEFKNDITLDSVYFIAEDISTQQQRYNEFIVTETSGTQVLTSGTITLNPTGFWTYNVYEQYSSTNLNPTLSDNTNSLETGKVKVIGSSQTYSTYSGQDIIYKVDE